MADGESAENETGKKTVTILLKISELEKETIEVQTGTEYKLILEPLDFSFSF